MRLKYLAFFVFTLFFAQSIDAQMHFGIRAGLNYSKFLGPSEEDVVDEFNVSGGFHFGLNFLYDLNEFVSIGTELTYTQNGSKQKYQGDSYYVFNTETNNRFVVRDSSVINMNYSNAYIHIPLTINVRTLEKWEFYGGGYINFLVSPLGTGSWRFGTSNISDTERLYHTFDQGQDHRYGSDQAGQFNARSAGINLQVNNQIISLPSLVGGYYLFPSGIDDPTKPGKRFATIDVGLTAGINYFINRGLYIGLRGEYGLSDLTNNDVDYSYKDVNADGSLIFKEDKDTHFGINVSLGFRF